MSFDQATYRILIAEDDPGVAEDYVRAFGSTSGCCEPGRAELDALGSSLFGAPCPPPEPEAGLFEVAMCSQGSSALETHAQASQANEGFDLALIDVRMPPGIDGVETARRLREADNKIPIGIVTGYSDLNFVEIAKQILPPAGLFFVRKPFVGHELRALVVERLCSV